MRISGPRARWIHPSKATLPMDRTCVRVMWHKSWRSESTSAGGTGSGLRLHQGGSRSRVSHKWPGTWWERCISSNWHSRCNLHVYIYIFYLYIHNYIYIHQFNNYDTIIYTLHTPCWGFTCYHLLQEAENSMEIASLLWKTTLHPTEALKYYCKFIRARKVVMWQVQRFCLCSSPKT